MAHATVEWTANLNGKFDRQGLLRLIAEEMRDRAGGMFPVGGIRVRAICCTEYVIADDADPDYCFINIDVKMGAGRPTEFRQRFFDQLFAAVVVHLGELFEQHPLALSLYVEEAEGWKKNSIHERLGKK